MIELAADNLAEIVAQNDTVVVLFSAGWCGNCRLMKPKFKRLSGEQTSAMFVIVDAEKFPASRKLANVNNLPTFASFKKGVLLSQVQTNKEEQLKILIENCVRLCVYFSVRLVDVVEIGS